MTTSQRRSLRRRLQRRREALDAATHARHSAEVGRRVSQNSSFARAQRVALYFGIRKEVGTHELAAAAWDVGKSVYLPRVISHTAMEFVPWRRESMMTVSKFGVPEPTQGSCLSPTRLDLVIVPVLGFDDDGNRLGYGGGYYDRAFGFRSGTDKPTLIGIAHSFQRVDNLSPASWDVPLDAVVTETGWVKELS